MNENHHPVLSHEALSPRLREEGRYEDGSKILLICKDKHQFTPKSLIFWLKLEGHHITIANTEESVQEALAKESFSTAFMDIAQMDSFSSKLFPVQSPPNDHMLLIGFSAKAEDETTTMPFEAEQEFAKRHGVHYYFPDPLEEKEIIQWMLLQRKNCSDIDGLCKQMDENIRLKAFHDREYIPVEDRHHHEVSNDYARHIDEGKRTGGVFAFIHSHFLSKFS